MSEKQTCVKCHRNLLGKNFVGKNGRPTKTCMNCRKVNQAPQQQYEEPVQKKQRKQYVSETSESESSFCTDSSDSEEDDDIIVCNYCDKQFTDPKKAEKHVNSAEHRRNMQQQ